MTRTSNHHDDEEDDSDAEDMATGTDTSSHRESKTADARPSSYRSKHSETEQRRRNKINQRFQILKELIPPNDQKRDKASLLLEVIEYIHFLQEKLRMYEGSYQPVLNQEPPKSIPWRASHGPVNNFGNHSQAIKNGSLDEDVAKYTTHGSLESELSGEFDFRGGDFLAGPTTPTLPVGVPFQSYGFVPGRSILPNENLGSHPHVSSIAQCSVLRDEDKAYENSSSSISNVYSEGLLTKLTLALQSSGVDLSQANISVQLDVGKRENNGSIAIATTGDVSSCSATSQLRSRSVDTSPKESFHATKRFKTGET